LTNYWKKLSTQTVFEHPRLVVVEDEVELPNGTQTKYMRYEGLRDYVTVIAQQDNKVLLVKEYSYPHDEWLWQFPEGDTETGEDPVASAQRELQEEADLKAGTMAELGMNYDHHRRTARKDYIFIATNLTEITGVQGDEEEQGIETKWFDIIEVSEMIARGEIRQKNTLAAWALFLTKTGGNKEG
jgi:8-oxo-dGTP pyrophosphatase MutT (NUDIX family)